MYKDWERNTAEMISGQLFGFLLIVGGVWSLNATRDGAAAFADFARGVRAAAGALLAEWPPWTRRKELSAAAGASSPWAPPRPSARRRRGGRGGPPAR